MPDLIDYFLAKKCRENHKNLYTLTREAIDILSAYHWPGNVRELENEIERLVVLAADNPVIDTANISQRILRSCYIGNHILHKDDDPEEPEFDDITDNMPSAGLCDIMEQFERRVIVDVLAKNGWNRSKSAEILGISRRQLIRKLEKYQIAENQG